jgi:hypothetical protein
VFFSPRRRFANLVRIRHSFVSTIEHALPRLGR